VVLILGRFTEERKAVLDGLQVALRARDYLPVLFDWEKPSNRDITETVSAKNRDLMPQGDNLQFRIATCS
jgi:hypothetical protein